MSKRPRKYQKDRRALWRVMDLNRPYTPNEATTLKLHAAVRLQQLIDGKATDDDFQHLVRVLGVTRLKSQDINPQLYELAQAGEAALKAAMARFEGGTFTTVTHQEQADVAKALVIYNAIVEMSAPIHLTSALEIIEKELQ